MSADPGSRRPTLIAFVGATAGDEDLLCRELIAAGVDARVIGMPTPEAAVRCIVEQVPEAVVADDATPGLDAVEALRRFRAVALEVPFIVVAAGGAGDDRGAELLAAGATDYVVRDRCHRLGAAVARALDEQRLRTELRNLQDRYQTIVEQIPAITYVDEWADGNDTPTFVSPQIRSVLGYTSEEWLDDAFLWEHIVHPDDIERVNAEQRRTREAHESLDVEYRVIARDSRTVWIHDHSTPVFDDEGNQRFTHGLMFDITERKADEATMRRRDAILAAVANAAETLLRANGSRAPIEDVLAQIGRAAGTQAIVVTRIEGPSDRPTAYVRHVWSDPPMPIPPAGTPAPVLDGDRDVIDVLRRGEVVAGPPEPDTTAAALGVRSGLMAPLFLSGRFWGSVSYGDFLEEREWTAAERGALRVAANTIGAAIRNHEAQAEVERSREEYRSLAATIPDLVARFDRDGRILYANPAFASLADAPTDRLLGVRLNATALPAEAVRAFTDIVAAAFASLPSTVHVADLELGDATTGRAFDVRAIAESDVDDVVRTVLVIAHDFTLRRDAIRALEKRDAVLEAVAFGAEALLGAERWSDALPDVLEHIGTAANADLVLVGRDAGMAEGRPVEILAQWTSSTAAPLAGMEATTRAAALRQAVAEVFEGGGVLAGNIRTRPDLAPLLEPYGVRSFVVVPIHVGDAWWGNLAIADCERVREWPSAKIGAFRTAADILGAAIERQRMIDALEVSEKHFRTLTENLPDIVMRFSADGRFLYANRALTTITGATPDEISETWAERDLGLGQDTIAHWRRLLADAAAEGRPVRFEGWHRSAIGDRYVDAQAIPERDETGAVESTLVIARDITERKLAEDALAERMKELRCLLNVTRDIQLSLDGDELARRTARNLEQGMSAAADSHAHVKVDAFGLACATPERPHLTADIEIDGVVRGEVGVCHAPDHSFIVPEEQDLVNAVAEALALWLQRRHALARMAESESRFRAMFENALDCIVLFDDEGRFLEVNESASTLFGMSRDELVQRCAEDFTVGPNDLAEAWTALRRDGSISGRWPLKLPSGEIRNTEFTSVANITPNCHLCVFRDVTDRIASQQELQESYDALWRADTQRRRLLAQLVSAHEEERFRIANDIHDDSIQVMTAVGMRLTILRKELEVGNDAELKKLEDTVEKAIKRLRHLLFELRPAALDRDGLVPALRQYLDMMLEQGGPVVSLEHDLAREPSPDTRILVFRLLQEALQNVRKHARASNVHIVVSSEKDGIRVGVRDDGKGFDTAQSMIALPGHLGLASMHERADLAGGWVRIESGRGEGTLVEFWVPDATGGSTGAPSDGQATFGA